MIKTVKELVEILKVLPQDAEITVTHYVPLDINCVTTKRFFDKTTVTIEI